MSTEIVNQMLKLAESLSEEEKQLLLQQLQPSTKPMPSNMRRLSPEEDPNRQQRHFFYLQWLQQHHQEYLGKWVVLADHRFICAANSAQAAFQEASKQGITKPFISYLSPIEDAPFGGW